MVDVLNLQSRFLPATGPVRLAAARHLGQETTPISKEAEDREKVSAAVRDLAVELRLLQERLKAELDLAGNAEMRRGIPLIGEDLSEGEVLETIFLTAQGLSEVARSALQGPLSSYTSPSIRTSLEESKGALDGIEGFVSSARSSIMEGHEGLVEEYLGAYLDDVKELRDAAERLLVSVESPADGDIPIKERGEEERQGAAGVLWAIGALLAGGVAVYLFVGE